MPTAVPKPSFWSRCLPQAVHTRALHESIRGGNVAGAIQALRQGADPNAAHTLAFDRNYDKGIPNKERFRALPPLFRALNLRGVSIENARSMPVRTNMTRLDADGMCSVFKALCEWGASLDSTDAQGNTLWHAWVALSDGASWQMRLSDTWDDPVMSLRFHVAVALRQANLPVSRPNAAGETPLDWALMRCDFVAAREMGWGDGPRSTSASRPAHHARLLLAGAAQCEQLVPMSRRQGLVHAWADALTGALRPLPLSERVACFDGYPGSLPALACALPAPSLALELLNNVGFDWDASALGQGSPFSHRTQVDQALRMSLDRGAYLKFPEESERLNAFLQRLALLDALPAPTPAEPSRRRARL